MAKKTSLLLLLLALSISVASGLSNPVPAYLPSPKKCGRNEFYKACVSSNCAENLCGESIRKTCVEDCVSGCYCAHDHYRNRLGLCVTSCEKDDEGYFGLPVPFLQWIPRAPSKNYFILGSYHVPSRPAG
ncbi:uncharacterized protein LOC119400357 [Rhipicephalus sanguineus]|uniref:uncharacterized protein LOC119400357 n=1 Tax=Rhipicephalus sanguineus TaxID=34632 RepID=UPI001892D67B|nr:uncharacterized protein LOC119400357 [Rhipicephalus sanguineus]